jgi:Cu/Ag efflux protein CusF
MIRTPTWLPFTLVLALSALISSAAPAADKIKSVAADQKQFVITNQEGKDITLTLADNARIFLPEGKDGSIKDLKAGQNVSFLWEEKGGKYFATAVLENSGNYKDAMLASVSYKAAGTAEGEFVVTDTTKKDWTLQVADKGKVTLNSKASKLSELKAGDKVILIFEKKGDKLSALSVFTDRQGAGDAAKPK